jgi:MFS family permease
MYTLSPVSEAYIIGHAPKNRRSTIMGIYYFVALEVGGMLAPVMGSFVDRFGFRSTFNVAAAVVAAVAVIGSVFLWGNRD